MTMTMNNDSVTNEKLIDKIGDNLAFHAKIKSGKYKVSVLRHTVFNNTILPLLLNMPCNFVPRNDKQHRENLATGYKLIRKYFNYNKALFCCLNTDSDTLYYAINDFKYYINSNYYNLFKSE